MSVCDLATCDVIVQSMDAHGMRPRKIGPGAWTCRLGTRRKRPASVWRDDEWLRCELPLGACNAAAGEQSQVPRRLLAWSGSFGPGVKLAINHRSLHAVLLAEMPLNGETGQAAAIQQRFAAWQAAVQAISAPGLPERMPPVTALAADRSARSTASIVAQDLNQLLAAAQGSGWAFAEQSRTCLRFVLEAPGGCRADLEWVAERSISLALRFDGDAEVAPVCHAARCLLLASANNLVRMVRAVETRSAGYQWEHTWDGVPGPCDLQHALAALCVAGRLTYGEFEILADPAIATEFLLRRGWSSPCVTS